LRATILQALREDSFSVSELCEMLDVPQPALSHHLKILHLAGLVGRRREGTSIFYRRDNDTRDGLKQALFGALDEAPPEGVLQERMARVHEARKRRCQAFFARHADEVSALHREIAEPDAYTDSVLQMASRLPREAGQSHLAVEVGPGDGAMLAGLARLFDQVVGMDSSREMLAHTSAGAGRLDNVTLVHGDFLEWRPEQPVDLVAAAMVLHHLPSPAGFFQQAGHVLAAGGSLIVADLTRHDQRWASEHCGDQWLGFEPAELERWATLASLEPAESLFLAQKNGFQIQIQRYVAPRR
jgi:ArsR family transcriptional regulator